MERCMNFRILFVVILSVFTANLCREGAVHAAGKIEADPNRSYPLSKQRGPWMIMAATFHTTSEDGQTQKGKTPRQAAEELVLELRKLGMPAYVYEYTPDLEKITVRDSIGREERRKNLRRVSSVCVLAGNYNDINDTTAQDSLAWIKKLRPKCLEDGVVFIPTPGRPGPLSGAFLTINPLLAPEEVEQHRKLDPLLVQLNNGERYSLFENPGRYSLVIARFYGKQATVKNASAIESFLKDNDLDNAAIAARELVAVLRGKFDDSGKYNNIDAYIWHGQYESVVTVGSFSGPDDPALVRYKERFGPSMQQLPNGVSQFQSQGFGVKNFGKNKDEIRLWIFEPNPELVEVPRAR